MGCVDKTLFLMRSSTDFLLVQIYVDDIIFGGSSHALVSKFSEQMSREFEMSMMGELQFFLGHSVRSRPLCAVSGFSAHLPQAGGETHLQVSEIHL